MADISLGTTSQSGSGSGTSLTWAHDCSGVANGVLFICTRAGTGDTTVDVKFNGGASAEELFEDASDRYWRLHRIVGPDAANANIVVTFGASQDYCVGCAVLFNNCLQVGQPGAGTVVTGVESFDNTLDLNLTTTVANSWIVGIGATAFSTSQAGGTGVTVHVLTPNNWTGLSSKGPVATPASTAYQLTASGGGGYMEAAIIELLGEDGGGGGSILPLVAADMANIANMQDMRG